MRIKERILYIVLSFFRLFLPLVKIKDNKILFVSLESDKLESEFKMINDQLVKKGIYDIHYLLVKFEPSILGSIKYFFVCIRQLFEINTSKLVILDFNNYVVSKFKRNGVNILQLWHASGAIKNFGNEIQRDYQIGNYDYIIANSKAFVEHYAKAFNVKENQIYITGIPKTDVLYKKDYHEKMRIKMLEKYPQIKDKKVILYAPTFRGRLMTGFKDAYMDLDKFYKKMGSEDYVIMYKMHPLLKNYYIGKNDGVICCNNENLYRLFSVSDYFISDYSAVVFDYSIMEKPMIFYTPDLETYRQETGIYLDYENEMPGPICFTIDDVVKAIKMNHFNIDEVKNFKKKYHKYEDGKSLLRVITLIDNIMN